MLATLVVFAGWLVAGLSVFGLGSVAARLARIRADLPSPFWLFWLGLAATVLALQLWQLALPINTLASALLVAVGAVGVALEARQRRWARPSAFAMAFAALGLVVGLWLANRALQIPALVDSGLYHYGNIRWLNEWPLVAGLGNLHGRFAFNQSYFLYVAALNVHPYFGNGYHVANSLLVAVFCAEGLWVAAGLWRGAEGSATSPQILLLLFFPVVARLALTPFYQAPSPDAPVLVVGAVVSCALAVHVAQPKSATLALIAALAALGTTVKMSFAAFGLSALAVAAFLSWRAGQRSLRQWIPAACFLVAPLAIWAVRGYVLSGYPLYPLSFGGLAVDWRVPPELLRIELGVIQSWARAQSSDFESVMSNWSWLGPWLRANIRPSTESPAFALGVGALSVLGLWLTRHSERRIAWSQVWVVVPGVISSAVWFFGAPDPRFAGASLWLLGLWPLALLVWRLLGSRRIVFARRFARGFVVVVWGIVLVSAARSINRTPVYGTAPQWPLRPYVTKSGLIIFEPAPVDGGPMNLCGNRELLCTPQPDPRLELRGADISSGFRLR